MTYIELKNNLQFTKYWSRYITRRKDYYQIKSDIDLKNILKREKSNRYLYYDLGYGSSKFTLVETSPGEIYDITMSTSTKFIKPNTSLKVSNKNKVFFSSSSFPSLLLGRVGLDIKRTTKPDSADVIVSDCNTCINDCFHKLLLLDIPNSIMVDIAIEYKEKKSEFINKVDLVVQTMKKFFNYDLKLYCQVIPSNLDEYEMYNKYSTKFITTEELTKYVISQLPVLQQTECDNICYMLKSQDKSTVSTALGTLQYYNFFDCGIDLLGALISTNCHNLPSNREAEYIYSLFGISRSTIIEARGYRTKRKIQFFMDVLNKFVITPTMSIKEKVINVLRQSLFDQIYNDYKDEFDRLDVTLNLEPNDKNGEADVSSSEVEGEEL